MDKYDGEAEEIYAFHGTSKEGIKGIAKGGFLTPGILWMNFKNNLWKTN